MKPTKLQRGRTVGLLQEKEFPFSGNFWEELRFTIKDAAQNGKRRKNDGERKHGKT